MTYFRALTNLHHTAREERGENPFIPAGACCDLDHRSEDEQNMLVAMGHIAPISDAEYVEWLATQSQPDKTPDISVDSTPSVEGDILQNIPSDNLAPSNTPKRRKPQNDSTL